MEPKVMTIDQDRRIRLERWKETGDGALYHSERKWGLLKKKENNIDTFLNTCVTNSPNSELDISELYKAYDDYCQNHDLPTYSIKDFLNKLDQHKIEYDNTTVKGITLTKNYGESNGHRKSPKREVFYWEKKRRFGRNSLTPVYLHIGGTACNVGFDDLVSYIQTNNNELVAADETTIGRLLGSSFSIGSKFGRDLSLETVAKMTKISVILNIVLIFIIFMMMAMGGGFQDIQYTVLGG